MALTIAWFWFIHEKIEEIGMPKSLNEFGDFLAGSFAPLAFYWLVLGYYLQGKGIQQNTEALKLQQVELQASSTALNLQVTEMQNSIKLQSLELKRQKKADIPIIRIKDPKFTYQDRIVFDGDTGEDFYQQYRGFTFILCNVGKIALDLKISGDFDDFVDTSSSYLKALVENEEYEIKYHLNILGFDKYFKKNSTDMYECNLQMAICYETQFEEILKDIYTIKLFRSFIAEEDEYLFRMVIT